VQQTQDRLATVVVHAGAGTWAHNLDAAVTACERAASAGLEVLAGNGAALEAVLAAVRVLEDDPVCNAGTGGALTSEHTLELDACVVDGSTRRSGAVGALPPFFHPIDVARAVMDDGRFNLLVGDGAARFAEANGFVRAPEGAMIVDRDGAASGNTVGAVALDSMGRLAAATSTGGISGQIPGRIGDTPIVGAATLADDALACSFTGHGEAIARACGAFWTSQQAAQGAQLAADRSIRRLGDEFDGIGGLIVVGADGQVGVSFNTDAMPNSTAVLGAPLRSGS
jgi:beta-aspartyl-peptidase (threonine type)